MKIKYFQERVPNTDNLVYGWGHIPEVSTMENDGDDWYVPLLSGARRQRDRAREKDGRHTRALERPTPPNTSAGTT
jgi:hypothetical protein